MIKAHNLTKIYTGSSLFSFRNRQKGTWAVNNCSLQIEEGQVFGLLGVNGAGKTTIVKMLCTLLEPTSGTVTVGGYDVVRDANHVRRIVNMIAGGERMLYWRLTGRENLSYFADLYHIEEKIKKKRIEELLDMVGLTAAANKRVEQYSKGMKQRLQIARGLINDPRYVFMDEPTIGLDATIAREIRRLIKEDLKLSKTILFTSHYMEEVEELCDVIAILHKGEIVEHGTVSQLKRRYRNGSIVVVTVEAKDEAVDQILHQFCLEQSAHLSAKVTEEGYQVSVHSTHNITSKLVDALSASTQRILELRAVEPSLEDVLIMIANGERK